MDRNRGRAKGGGLDIFFFFSIKSPTGGMKTLIKSSKKSLPGKLFSGQISPGGEKGFFNEPSCFQIFLKDICEKY